MVKKFKLSNQNVNRRVRDRVGVYVLYRSYNGPVRYVGMSQELATRIKQHKGKGYRYFSYEYKPSIRQAYKKEGRLFHAHGGTSSLDNEIHPPKPSGVHVNCPCCSLHR